MQILTELIIEVATIMKKYTCCTVLVWLLQRGGVVSHNVLYYQQLAIAPYQVSVYAKHNYLEKLPIVHVPIKQDDIASAFSTHKS